MRHLVDEDLGIKMITHRFFGHVYGEYFLLRSFFVAST